MITHWQGGVTFWSLQSTSAFQMRCFVYWTHRHPDAVAQLMVEGVGRFSVMLLGAPAVVDDERVEPEAIVL